MAMIPEHEGYHLVNSFSIRLGCPSCWGVMTAQEADLRAVDDSITAECIYCKEPIVLSDNEIPPIVRKRLQGIESVSVIPKNIMYGQVYALFGGEIRDAMILSEQTDNYCVRFLETNVTATVPKHCVSKQMGRVTYNGGVDSALILYRSGAYYDIVLPSGKRKVIHWEDVLVTSAIMDL